MVEMVEIWWRVGGALQRNVIEVILMIRSGGAPPLPLHQRTAVWKSTQRIVHHLLSKPKDKM